ncbi:GntR family transcriptional regulator [Microbacterium sp. MYb62]|uniref:GntR family transcriptional regulator n=1 Tax=Microbacterium sp. MYb62 TaxID=1848690 RepID=UPI000CFB59AC|nr:GntR family transcriptional regulator [Microbacterium sp. MYb62]PRB16572.1 GntR family transcriptional regulator [Microbacterium sp. MYb62]
MPVIERHAAPLRQQVLTLLREEILEGRHVPGERLREQDLCVAYGVSRTVIREVLRQLESESLISVIPGRGPIVAVLSKHDIASLYEVRAALEGLAASLFARRASSPQAERLIDHLARMERTYLQGDLASREESKSAFYRILLDGAGNEVLTADLAGVHTRIGLFRRYAFLDDGRVAQSYEELRAIVRAAAEDRDPEAARSASVHHIELAGHLAILEYERRVTVDGGVVHLDEVAV